MNASIVPKVYLFIFLLYCSAFLLLISPTVSKREENLLQEIATTVMKVDTNFIKRALLARAAFSVQGQQVLPIDQGNLAIAMQVEPFRRLLSIHLIRHIHRQLEGMDRRNESTRCYRAVESR
jgi:hypothetical protein